jgi:hypothetical protein
MSKNISFDGVHIKPLQTALEIGKIVALERIRLMIVFPSSTVHFTDEKFP